MHIACHVLRQELPVGGALRKLHGPQYAGVRKLRALCVSVIFAEHRFHENPQKYACSKQNEIDSSLYLTVCALCGPKGDVAVVQCLYNTSHGTVMTSDRTAMIL